MRDFLSAALTSAGLHTSGLVALPSGAVAVAGLHFGRDLLVPIVLAVLLAFVLSPLVRMLRWLRLGDAPSVLVAAMLGFAVLIGIIC